MADRCEGERWIRTVYVDWVSGRYSQASPAVDRGLSGRVTRPKGGPRDVRGHDAQRRDAAHVVSDPLRHWPFASGLGAVGVGVKPNARVHERETPDNPLRDLFGEPSPGSNAREALVCRRWSSRCAHCSTPTALRPTTCCSPPASLVRSGAGSITRK